MIKAIFFDMGGVLRDLDVELCRSEFRKLGFSDIENYLNSAAQKGFIGEFERGDIDTAEFVRQCQLHCAPGTTEEQVRKAFTAILPDFMKPEIIDFLREIKGMGYDLFVLSNNNPISSAQFMDKCRECGLEPESVFTKFFFSFRMHLMKPGQEIFQACIRESGYKPEEILFVDDAPGNIEAGKAAGLKTHHHIPGSNLREGVLNALS